MNNKEPPENPMNSNKGDQSCTAEEALTPRGTMVVGGESRSTMDHLRKCIIKEETNKILLGEENMENLHESGEVNDGNLTLENMLPILGIEGEEESEKQRGTEGAM